MRFSIEFYTFTDFSFMLEKCNSASRVIFMQFHLSKCLLNLPFRFAILYSEILTPFIGTNYLRQLLH